MQLSQPPCLMQKRKCRSICSLTEPTSQLRSGGLLSLFVICFTFLFGEGLAPPAVVVCRALQSKSSRFQVHLTPLTWILKSLSNTMCIPSS